MRYRTRANWCRTANARSRRYGLDNVAGRVEFRQGDAHNLKPQHSGYDLVLAANLINRLFDPAQIIADIGARTERRAAGDPVALRLARGVHPARQVARREEGLREDLTTLAALRAQLAGTFNAVGEPRTCLSSSATRRKHQHTVSQLTAWRRR